jgi:hypothetical protein
MYTPFATRQLASLEAAKLRRAARRDVSLWGSTEQDPAMSAESDGSLQALREQSHKGLQYLINYLLTNAEQALLAMAGKAQNKGEQARCYAAMGEFRLKRGALDTRFIERVMGGFDTIGEAPAPPAPPKPKAPQTLSLDAPDLGMMDTTALEEGIAVDNIASRASLKYRPSLQRLAQHVSRESGQRRLDLDSLPIGPLALTRHFMDVCGELEVDSESKALFVRLFSRFVIDELQAFYDQCIATIPVVDEPSAAQAARATETLVTHVLPTAKRESEHQQTIDASRAEAIWDSSRTPLLAPPGRAMAMPRNVLDEVLQGLQQRLLDRTRPLPALNPKAGIQPLEMFELINESLAELGYKKPMALTGDVVETINLVRLLFEHSLRDARVAAPVRRLARLLQIPLLRAALREPEVMSGADHPVRQFFKEIGAAAIGWTPQGELAADEFFRKIQSLVARVIRDYDKDTAVFTACLGELKSYMSSEQGRVRLLEQRTLSAATGKAESQAARQAIAAVVAAATEGKTLPAGVMDFLRGDWSDALFVIRLTDGDDSAAWGIALETTGRLATLVARQSPEGFAAIARGLKNGLLRLGLDETLAAARVAELQQLIGVDAAPQAEPAVQQEPVAAASPARPPASPEYLVMVDKLAPDTWFEFRRPGAEPQRARLLTMIRKTGQFLFVNREGAQAGEWHREELASALQSGEVSMLTGPTAPSSGRWGRR